MRVDVNVTGLAGVLDTLKSLPPEVISSMQTSGDMGVYAIVNRLNGKFYIGSTIRKFRKRFQCHKTELNKGMHHSQHMQRAWDKYGQDVFAFIVVECVAEKNDVLAREQYYIDTLKPEYNNAKIAGSQIGIKHTDQARRNMSEAQRKLLSIPGYKERRIASLRAVLATEESKQRRSKIQSQPHLVELRSKISKAMWAQDGFKEATVMAMKKSNAMPDVKARKSAAVSRRNIESSKITREIAHDIYDALLMGVSGAELARKYGIGQSSVSRIKSGNHWALS